MLSRRKLLATSVMGTSALALAACTTAQISSFEQNLASFISSAQSLVSATTGIIPTVESVTATIAALFGPQWSATVALGSAVLNAVVSAIEAAIQAGSTLASTKLRTSSPLAPVVVGKLANGTRITGYKAQ